MSVYTIRGMDSKTKAAIQSYANAHGLNVAEAVRDLVFFGLQHIRHTKKEKKYSSIFEVKEKLSFEAEPDLSKKIDEIVYED